MLSCTLLIVNWSINQTNISLYIHLLQKYSFCLSRNRRNNMLSIWVNVVVSNFLIKDWSSELTLRNYLYFFIFTYFSLFVNLQANIFSELVIIVLFNIIKWTISIIDWLNEATFQYYYYIFITSFFNFQLIEGKDFYSMVTYFSWYSSYIISQSIVLSSYSFYISVVDFWFCIHVDCIRVHWSW